MRDPICVPSDPLPDLYRQLVETAPDAMVVVDAKGIITIVNAQTEHLFGYARAELLGRPIDLLIPERFRPGHGTNVARFVASGATRAMGAGLELSGRRKDGTELGIEVSLAALHTDRGVLVSAAIRDVSERAATDARARLVSERLASAVESIQDAFALFDREDRLVSCNSAYRRLVSGGLAGSVTGESYERLLDAWLDDVAFSSDAERAQFRAERLGRHRQDPTTTFDLKMRDGRHLRVIDRRTTEGGTVKTVWDLTDDVRLAEELNQVRVAADAASRAKSEFLSSMSHELRTPMNAILGFAQLLRRDARDPLSERNKKFVDHILRGGQHLLRLIDDILDLSHIEAGGVSVSIEPIDVVAVLEEVKATLATLATAQGIRMDGDLLPASPPVVAADRTRFMQILTNFGANAIKYNRAEGSVRFVVSSPSPGRVRVTVKDTGGGIPYDKQGRLFQPFQRAGQETGPIQGTGIGLVVTKRLAELMDGAVGFESTPGRGSEFWVELPTHQVRSSSKPPAQLESSDTRSRAGIRRRVLYVEDNAANVDFMVELLRTVGGVDLLVAPSAELGIPLIRDQQPDVVIMDIHLPGMSGLDALRILRADDATRGIPILAMTAAAYARDVEIGMDAGFDRYLTKPVKVDELVAALDALFLADA